MENMKSVVILHVAHVVLLQIKPRLSLESDITNPINI